MATTQELTNAYDESVRQKKINDIYDAQKQSKLSELESVYNQNKSDYEAEAAKIPEIYQTQKNNLATQYEIQKRNFNQSAAATGINSGTSSQAALSMGNNYQKNYNSLNTAQADAQTEASKSLADLESQYRISVASAIADNDYQRATALMSAYENDKADSENEAALKANYGDFSGYASLYGEDTANNMRQIWIIQNPDIAYNTGAITVEEYKNITGSYPAGYAQTYTGYSVVEKDPLLEEAEQPAEDPFSNKDAKIKRSAEVYRDLKTQSEKDRYMSTMYGKGYLTEDEIDFIIDNYKNIK